MQKEKPILVVDDDPLLCDAVSKVLREAGYPTEMAFDGEAALQLLDKRPFKLILADVEMPYLNGYQLLQKVRQNPAWRRLPLVFLSGRDLDSDIRFGKQLGADDYLTKPLNVPDLLACVEGKLTRFEQLEIAPQHEGAFPQTTRPTTDFTIGALRIDTRQHRVWLHNNPLTLSAREFALLQELARHDGAVLSPQSLVKVTHEIKTDEQEAGILIRPLIRSLRRRLGYPTGETGCIESVRGVGYRLLPPT